MTTPYQPILINHSPLTTYSGNAIDNYIGAQSVAGQRGTLPTFTNANSIFVAKTGSDSNAGTAASPRLTLNGAMAAIVGTSLAYVVIQDSGTYSESFTTQYTTGQLPGFVGIYAADGQTPVFTLIRGAIPGTYGAGNPARIVTGTPNYYISKAGNDGTGTRGNAALPFKTIQAALGNSSRQAADIFQITDSGIYNEDLSFGVLTATLRSSQGQTPTLKAFSLVAGNGQISWASNAAIVTVAGIIIDGTASVNYTFGTSNGSVNSASITFKNCTFINNYNMSVKSSGIFNNCFFIDTVAFSYVPAANPFPSIGNTFTNCNFTSQLNGNGQYLLPLGFNSGTFTNCTFNNIEATGSFSPAGAIIPVPFGKRPTIANVPGAFNYNTSFNYCFFNNSSLNLNYYQLAVFYEQGAGGYQVVNFNVSLSNSVFQSGNVTVTNNATIQQIGSEQQNVFVTINNIAVYANGLPYGISIAGSLNQFSDSGQYSTFADSNIFNAVVSGATSNNFQIQRNQLQERNSVGTVIQNCTSLGSGSDGFNITTNPAYPAPYLTFTGNADSGSPTAFVVGQNATPALILTFCEANANVISSVQGSENCTLAANDLGNFAGPFNSLGGPASIGYDVSLFDLSVPCTLNGLTFAGWEYPGVPEANLEGGIQSSNGSALTIQNCTFNTSGTFAIKPSSNSKILNCLFNECTGHAIASPSTNVIVKNNVAVGCSGAFYLNFGQAAVIQHNTAYNCEYGEYDALQISLVTSDSNIFNGSGAYDYSGASTLTYSCVGTLDPNTLAAVDIYSTQLDPLFQDANGGNVMLQSLAYQYFYNSPCILTASDGTDMGAYQITYGVASTAWTELDFSTTSPDVWYNPDVLPRKIKSVKLAEDDQENGAVYSVAATYKEVWTLSWKEGSNPMPADQKDALKTMFESFSNQVQISFQDSRGFIPAYLARMEGFEWNDMIGTYASAGPLPVKTIVIHQA